MAGTDVFAALANPTRRALLDLLRERPRPVNELADEFAMRRPSVSEHLKVLRDAGLVVDERRGRERIYRVDPAPLRDVAAWLDPYETFWRDRLGGLRRMLDEEHDT
ncbi:MAG TPA: metalloregulator ArsR/SmtB family transcription factor [Euzebyales bacterium]|nr:metalloregulator ArsR/SmtB family transcription factor [Euzebyales bacterium]